MTASETADAKVPYRQRASTKAFVAFAYLRLAVYQVVYLPAKATASYSLWVAKKAGAVAGFLVLSLIVYLVGALLAHGSRIVAAAIYERFQKKMVEDPAFGFALAVLWSTGVVVTATWAFFWIDESVEQFFEGLEGQLDDEEILVDATDTTDDD